MIAALRGEVVDKTPETVWVDVNGVIYELFVSLTTLAEFNDAKGKKVFYIYEIIREDAYHLYGFIDKNEKEMFSKLIKLNGVGPKVAMAICSTFTPSRFLEVIEKKSVELLKKVPGIGPKSAKKILVELGEFSLYDAPKVEKSEAFLALESLGFQKEMIEETLKKISVTNTQEAIKEALKLIHKGGNE